MALLCLLATPIDNALSSPGELHIGRKLCNNLPTNIHNNDSTRDAMREQLQSQQSTQKAYHDWSARELPPLVPGQAIHVHDPVSDHWDLAKILHSSEEPCSYIIKTPNGSTLHQNRCHLQDVQPTENRVRLSDKLETPTAPVTQTSLEPTSSECMSTQQLAMTGPASGDGNYITRSGRVSTPPIRVDMWNHINMAAIPTYS